MCHEQETILTNVLDNKNNSIYFHEKKITITKIH